MTDIQEQAAQELERLLGEVASRDAELMRVYEISAIFFELAKQYLKQVITTNDEEVEAVSYVRAAVYAVENNTTVAEAKLVIDEEKTE